MKVAHVIVGGEVAGGQVVCGQVIEALTRRGDRAIVISPTEGSFTERLRQENIPVYIIPAWKTYHFFNALRLAGILKKERADLVHTHAMVQVNVQARLGAWIAGIPVISHLHLPNHFRKHPLIRAYQVLADLWTARLCDEMITVSEATKETLLTEGKIYGKAKVIYNGVDSNQFTNLRPREAVLKEFGLNSTQRLIGTVGRLCPAKGQREFILSAREILAKVPESIFMIVGKDIEQGGNYERELRQLVFESGLTKQVIFTGYRPDVLELLNAFDLFVLSSKIEGFPLVLLEAMALGKAVVATEVGGVPELVVRGETGFLVPPSDWRALSSSVVSLLSDPRRIRQMGEAGRRRVREQFSEDQMTNAILSLYDRCVRSVEAPLLAQEELTCHE